MLKTFKLTLQKQQLGGKYRSFTTSTSTSSSPPQTPTKILISPLIDPYFNKAIEDFHLSHTKLKAGEQLLYLWQNEPTVFIGRNQNPWKECHLNFMEEDKVHLVRRFTGGGAVYQVYFYFYFINFYSFVCDYLFILFSLILFYFILFIYFNLLN